MSPVSWTVALWSLSALLGAAPADAPPYEIDVSEIASGADACPSQTELAEALESHMPGVVAHGAREPGTSLLRLGLTLSPDGLVRVTMTDAAGALRLERELDLPKSGAGPSARDRAACAALAETVTLIVERYMRHIGYHEPPPPALVAPPMPREPPPPPAPPSPPPRAPWIQGRLGLGLAARLPYLSSWRIEPQLTGGVRFGQLDVSALVGVALLTTEDVPMTSGQGALRLRTIPVRGTLGWTVPIGARLALVPSVAGGVDVVRAETHGIDQGGRSSAAEPMAEAGLRLLAQLTRRVWIDAFAFQGLAIRPETFSVKDAKMVDIPIFTTPRVYTRVGVDFGIYLGKN
jgi:hypothetical protein